MIAMPFLLLSGVAGYLWMLTRGAEAQDAAATAAAFEPPADAGA
ncbi:MAG: hypothetical protein ACYTGX_07310 [Planctomycetota bacterium]|jgi:hypothetical protein